MKLTLGNKVSGGLAITAVMAASIAVTGFVAVASLEGVVRDYARNKVPGLAALNQLSSAMGIASGAASALENGSLDAEVHRQALSVIHAQNEAADRALQAFAALPSTSAAQSLSQELDASFSRWREDIALLTRGVEERAAAAGHFAEQAAIQQKVTAAFERLRGDTAQLLTTLDKLIGMEVSDGEALGLESSRKMTAARWTLGTASVLGLLMVAIGGFVLARSIAGVMSALQRETGTLLGAVNDGRLDVRANPAAVNWEFRPLITGINSTIDAFVKPIRVTAEYVDRLARGDIPPRIPDAYAGDFNVIRDNLNTCIDAVQGLAADAMALSKAAVEGKLSMRADPSKHQGDYRRIVEGVNATLDAVMGPINEAAQVLDGLAGRDLTTRVKGSYAGDHARIKEAVNATAQALHESVAQVAQAVGQVSSASSQIASSSQAVASGASEQAASLQETSASLQSMASMTRQATDNAQQANGLAQRAKAAASEGSTAMEQMTGAMGKIKASAEGTSQIIKDINEIAFQTNLLALNAAVEAARAGEAGRGFAVVAEEVRSLALRSKDAATKTEELIRQSVKEAGEGEVTARRVHDKLAEITGSVMKVTDIVAEMAATSREQAAGIDQVTKAVTQMSDVTQQNAASSEESSSAAAELSAQSEELAAMVGTFRLDGTVAARSTAASPGKSLAHPLAARRPAKRPDHQRSGAERRPIEGSRAHLIPFDGELAFREF